ncbi:hypothetical protein ES332_A12G050600v1 [Gossypium tomentosum]|uniref:Uncharacterized protein n=1 Tax=Gossypium tomentosum TaxID=34277 RepID=A0A5D2MVP9_GOSTO|nr:hypothetical protein ES332_A12G050600v1 [Gossypium tomentosum]
MSFSILSDPSPSSPPSLPLSQAPLFFCRPPHHCPLPLLSLFLLHHHFSHPQQSCHVQRNEPLCPYRQLKCSSFSHSSSNSFSLNKVLIYLSIKSMDE